MSLYSDLNEVLTPYANKIKALDASDDQIKADIVELQSGGYIADAQQIQSKVNAYLANHPEIAVLDGSLTESKFSDALKLKTIKDYVTPEMFGANGDGVTDDSDAFNSAFSSGYNVICKSDKTYYLENTIHIANKCIFDGNNATFKLKPYSARHQVFRVEADGVIVKNLIGVSEFTGTYNNTTPSDCNQFIFIASSDVLVENIRTNTVFSSVWLNDGNSTIKKHIVINNVISINGQFNIFARYVDGLTISNCYLTVNSANDDFHQLYISSHVTNVDINNITILGNGKNFVSLHPSSSYTEIPDITNVKINNIVVKGIFSVAIEFRSCSDVIVSNAYIVSENSETTNFLIRHEASDNIVIKDSILKAVNSFIYSPNPSDGNYESEHTSEITINNCFIDYVANAQIQMIYRVCICKIINSTIRVTGLVNNPYVFCPTLYDVLTVLNCVIYSVNKSIHIFRSDRAEVILKLIGCKAYTAVTRLNFGVYTEGNVYVYGCKGFGFTHCVSGADDFNAITGALDNNIYANVVQIE